MHTQISTGFCLSLWETEQLSPTVMKNSHQIPSSESNRTWLALMDSFLLIYVIDKWHWINGIKSERLNEISFIKGKHLSLSFRFKQYCQSAVKVFERSWSSPFRGPFRMNSFSEHFVVQSSWNILSATLSKPEWMPFRALLLVVLCSEDVLVYMHMYRDTALKHLLWMFQLPPWTSAL